MPDASPLALLAYWVGGDRMNGAIGLMNRWMDGAMYQLQNPELPSKVSF
ncbi:hypothetical protein [Leptolyngbya ohadii]|nr:hypothetical protein [Leptolyngbya ohadii]